MSFYKLNGEVHSMPWSTEVNKIGNVILFLSESEISKSIFYNVGIILYSGYYNNKFIYLLKVDRELKIRSKETINLYNIYGIIVSCIAIPVELKVSDYNEEISFESLLSDESTDKNLLVGDERYGFIDNVRLDGYGKEIGTLDIKTAEYVDFTELNDKIYEVGNIIKLNIISKEV